MCNAVVVSVCSYQDSTSHWPRCGVCPVVGLPSWSKEQRPVIGGGGKGGNTNCLSSHLPPLLTEPLRIVLNYPPRSRRESQESCTFTLFLSLPCCAGNSSSASSLLFLYIAQHVVGSQCGMFSPFIPRLQLPFHAPYLPGPPPKKSHPS